MQITTRRLYDRLLENSPAKVRVNLGTRAAFDNLRTALTKLNRIPRDLLDAGNLCSDWDTDTGIAAFWVGAKRRQENTFEILGDDNAPVPAALEPSPGSQLGAETTQSEDSSEQSCENLAGDSEREIYRESSS